MHKKDIATLEIYIRSNLRSGGHGSNFQLKSTIRNYGLKMSVTIEKVVCTQIRRMDRRHQLKWTAKY